MKIMVLRQALYLWAILLLQVVVVSSSGIRHLPARIQLSPRPPRTNKAQRGIAILASNANEPPLSSGTNMMRKDRVLHWIPVGVKNALASGLAAILVKTMLQPFDTIKTIQQIQTVEQSLMATAQQVLKDRGIWGLWSGTFVSAVCAAPASAVYFGVFSSVKKRLASALPPHLRFLAVGTGAMVANSIASFLRVPYEVYKQRLQAGLHKDLTSAVMHSWKTEGLIGLFAGGKLASQIIRDIPYAIIGAIAYDVLQRLMTKRRLEAAAKGQDTKSMGQMQDAICGAFAGGISTYLTTPMDVIKTRLMINDKYASVPDAVRRILREDGFGTFFAGANSRLLYKIPANGLFFLFYEALRFMLGAVEHRSEQ